MSKVPAASRKDYVKVGEVVGAHGIDGTIKIYPTTDFIDRLLHRHEIWLEEQTVPHKVREARIHQNTVLMRLEGVVTREQALLLRGQRLWIPIQSLPPLPDGEYYWHQLVGMTVVERQTGRELGTLQQVVRTGSHHDLFQVERKEAKPLLIPALRSVVQQVDLVKGVMEVDLPLGLEDAT
ncbi:MAG: ribosome maturation factor RimM [Sulfobacillus sp.]